MILVSLMVATSLLRAENELTTEVRMPDIVLDAIKHCECLQEGGSCNPNVIRINADDEAQRAADAGITNLDLGPYQINYKYHPNPMLHEYFEDSFAREQANGILTKLVKSFGYSWETLGRYHHFSATDRTRNERYYRKMYAFIYGNNSNAQGSN